MSLTQEQLEELAAEYGRRDITIGIVCCWIGVAAA